MTRRDCTGRAHARVGLLGNPSDGYGGRVIAMTLPQFAADVTVSPATAWRTGDDVLLDAIVTALKVRRPELVAQPAAMTFTTTVPRQVGLAGSSAIIIAAMRALAARSQVEWNPVELARAALEVETDVLGWAAGPQDRVVQAYEGLIDMDFAEPWRPAGYQRLDVAALPPLFVAWNQSMGEPSDQVHSQVRNRWLAGDEQVIAVMHDFADLAASGRAALDAGTADQLWPSLLDRAFELRRAIWDITDVDRALVETGQRLGAGVAFAGSGGAIVGCPVDANEMNAIESEYHDLGAGFAVIA